MGGLAGRPRRIALRLLRFVVDWGRPTALALSLAFLAWPLVALSLNLVVDISSGEVIYPDPAGGY
jgi:hypothetical protein